jgi:phage regulator Rha-like protein
MEPIVEKLEELEEDLLTRAFLYRDPATYREAIEVSFERVRAELERARVVA